MSDVSDTDVRPTHTASKKQNHTDTSFYYFTPATQNGTITTITAITLLPFYFELKIIGKK